MAAIQRKIIPVILSGGTGTRLWPLSRARRPKQMLELTGDETMLKATAMRVADPRMYAAPLVVAGTAQAEAIEAELGEAIGALILEPAPRNTAPAIALAALAADRGDVLLVLPSDHLIRDVAGFQAAVAKGLPFAEDGWIVTFGMKPDRAETGYGYIERGEALADGVYAGVRFVEKPDAAAAERYVAGRRHDWNGGIFLLKAGVLLDALAAHAPDMFEAAGAAMRGQRRERRRVHPDGAAFRASPAQSIDYAVMEKAERIAVVPASLGWSDVGSWAALYDAAEKDEAGNAAGGDMLAIDSAGCLIRSEGPLVAAIGVEDLVIVATADAVLVVPRGDSQRVKEAVEALKAQGRDALL